MDRLDARDVIQRQLHTGHDVPIWTRLGHRHIRNALGMRGRYRFGFVFTHFGFLLMFGPDKWMQTKIPCRFNSLHGICWRTVRPIRTEGKAALNLAKTAKKGYTYPSGADLIRCVGGLFTCAGTGELALPCTAVIFVFLTILYYRTNVLSIIIVEKCANILLKTEKFITF